MNDQAAALREMAAIARSGVAEPAPASSSTAVVLGSGKGGVGKSVLAVLLANALARQGRRVLLLDGSQNQGNLHILLGVRPAAPLTALLDGEAEMEKSGAGTVTATYVLWNGLPLVSVPVMVRV